MPANDGYNDGILRLGCPNCPTMGVNLYDDELINTPSELSHIAQQNLTNDGNFQLNQYAKSTVGDGHCLWEGRGYSLSAAELESVLKAMGNDVVEVSKLFSLSARRNTKRRYSYTEGRMLIP